MTTKISQFLQNYKGWSEQEKYQKRFVGRNSSANKNGKIKEAKIVKQKPEKSVKTDKSNKKK